MTTTPIFAENYGPLSFLMFLVPALFVLFSIVCLPLNASWGRRRWWGLVAGLIPTVGGGCILGYFLFCDSSVPGDPGVIHNVKSYPVFFILMSIPFLCGLGSLFLWSREREA